ncbi:Telomere length and silencing protein 1 [Balamuthia mandrillaris]
MEFRMKKARESLERTLQEKGMTLEKVIADKKQLQEERKKNEGEGQAKTEVMIEEEQIDMLMLKEAERRLYEIPEHLRVEEKPRSDDTISESWLTGIQEVELPMEFKLRNIEATEEAKKQILEGKTAPEPEDVGYNTRFQRPSPITQVVRANRKRGDSERKGQDQQRQHGDSNNANQPRPDRRNQATDDLAFERFKKRFRY